MAEYGEQTKEELYALAQSRGIEGISAMNKDELIATLEADDRGEVPTVDESGNEVTPEASSAPSGGTVGVSYGDGAARATVTEFSDAGVATTRTLSGDEAREAIDAALMHPPTPEPLRALAEKLPEKDEVQRETKAAMLAENPVEEVRHKAAVVEASPDAPDTPSGHALQAVQGESSPSKQGEVYASEKSARRWGYAPVEQ